MKSIAPLEPAICVADLEQMRAFYCDLLGFKVYNCVDVAPEKSGPPGLAADGYTIMRLETNDGQRFKLVHPNAPAQSNGERDYVLDRRGLAFVTFLIDDLDDVIARLEAAGAELMGRGEKFEVRDGVFIIFVRDPEGNCLELVQYTDIASYRPELAASGRQ